MRRSILIALMGCGAVLAATPAAAEQYPGWYGGVDLGYNQLIARPVVVGTTECIRRQGVLGTRRGGAGTWCNIPRLVLPVAPRGTPVRAIGDIGWLSSDLLAREFAAACARASGRLATSGEYAYCVPSAAVRR